MKTLITLSFLLLAFITCSSKSYSTDLSEAEKNGIQIMREDEKLAHDVYVFLYEKWEIPIFNNISNSETKHFNAIGSLIETFELKDFAKKETGKFYNTDLQQIYDSLIMRGSESLVEALKVGAFIEELDIADLQQSISSASNETIINVYQNLLRASGNHIRAFTGQLAGRDFVYSPVILNEKEYQAILATPHQRGGGTQSCGMQNINAEENQKRGGGKMHRHRGRNN